MSLWEGISFPLTHVLHILSLYESCCLKQYPKCFFPPQSLYAFALSLRALLLVSMYNMCVCIYVIYVCVYMYIQVCMY